MITYQDLQLVQDDEQKKMAFVRKTIDEHKASDDCELAATAELYYRHKNKTINEFKKWIYLVTGGKTEDLMSANFKLASNIFYRLVLNETHFSLGNGIRFNNKTTKNKLSNKKYDFDKQVDKAGKAALVHGVSFGFWNLDHIEIFKLTEFKPLWDEETGALMAGIRYWQLASDKPLRAVLYERDGYTSYIWRRRKKDGKPIQGSKGEILHEKQPYKKIVVSTPADGETIIDGENYDDFPIVPFWGNELHQSEFVGLQEWIDCMDLIASGFANTVDEASFIMWTLKNANGMDEKDLVDFIDHIRKQHIAVTDDDAIPHQLETPYEGREALLDRLERSIYRDFMAVNSEFLTTSGETATAIKAAFEPQNIKADEFEYCVIQFIMGILKLAGIDDKPTFERAQTHNEQEEVTTALAAQQVTGEDYTLQKVLAIMGDIDKYDDILKKRDADAIDRISTEDEEADEEAKEDENE